METQPESPTPTPNLNPRSHYLVAIGSFLGVVALAIVVQNLGFFNGAGQVAAVVCSDSGECEDELTIGGSTLSISAASGQVAYGATTTITWNATNVDDVPFSVTCFGDASGTCGNISNTNGVYQTLSGSSNDSLFLGTKAFSIGNDRYLAVAATPEDEEEEAVPSRIYKWNSTTEQFELLQSIWSYFAYDVNVFSVASVTYLAIPSYYGNTAIYQWMPGSNCFGNGNACATPTSQTTGVLQQIWSHNPIDSEVFTSGGKTYLAIANYDTSGIRVYEWMPTILGRSSLPLHTSGNTGTRTFIDRSWTIDNGASITHVGFYASQAGQTVSVKIARWNSSNSYTIVASQNCTSVVGWNECALSYAVPATGTYHAAVFANSNILRYTSANVAHGRSGSGVNVAQGVTQSFTHDNNNAPGLFVKYASPVTANCFGNGSYRCADPNEDADAGILQSIYASDARGVATFTEGEKTYLAVANEGDGDSVGSRIYEWMPGSNCFGNGSACATLTWNAPGTLQSIYSNNAFDILTFAKGGKTYLIIVNEDEGSTVGTRLYEWMPGSNCFGNGNACASLTWTVGVLQSIYSNSAFGASVYSSGLETYLAIANNSNGSSVGTRVYSWTPSGISCPSGGGFGDGSQCATLTWDAPGVLQSMRSSGSYAVEFFSVGTDIFLGVSNYVDGSAGGLKLYKTVSQACFGSGTMCSSAVQNLGSADDTTSFRFFTLPSGVGEGTFLAQARSTGANRIYKWSPLLSCWGNGSTCGSVFQQAVMDDAYDLEVFTPNGTTYYLVASRLAGGSDPNMRIFVWMPNANGGQGCFGSGSSCATTGGGSIQSLMNSDESYDAEIFTEGGNTYMVVATDDSGDVRVFRWMTGSNCFGDGSSCGSTYQRIWGDDTHDAEIFVIGGTRYVSISDYSEGGGGQISIYKWLPALSCFGNNSACATEPSSTVYYQRISSDGPIDTKFFTIGGIPYLAEARDGTNTSRIFKWVTSSNCFGNGSSCGTPFQTFSSSGAREIEYFEMEGTSYLAVANNENGSSFNSRLYIWNPTGGTGGQGCFGRGGACGEPYQRFVTDEAHDWEYFEVSGKNYLAMANRGSNTSRIYRWMSDTEITSAPGCTVSSFNSQGEGGVAQENTGSIETEALTEDTTYTLTCNTSSGLQSVAITIDVTEGTLVTVGAIDEEASEAGDTGTFRIYRSESNVTQDDEEEGSDVESYPFGGLYMTKNNSCLISNPLTGGCTCPNGGAGLPNISGGFFLSSDSRGIHFCEGNGAQSFGGMYLTKNTSTCLNPNPYTGSCTCPVGTGMPASPGLLFSSDNRSLWFCQGEGSGKAFGGMYMTKNSSCLIGNPYTSGCTCPDGLRSLPSGGMFTSSDSRVIWFCGE